MVSDETLIDALEAVLDVDDQPVANGELVAASLPIEGEAARQRLLRIAADGDVSTAKIGGARVFWTVDALRESAGPEPPEARLITDSGESAAMEAGGAGSPDGDPHPSGAESGSSFDADRLRRWLDGRPPQKRHGKDAIVDVVARLVEAGGDSVETSELRSVVYEGREDKWGGERPAWNSVNRYLADVPGVDGDGAGEWWIDVDVADRELPD